MRAIRLRKSQEGVVSLLVTMVLMIVVSLIALGFAQIARRNQGQELDQQLSTQAFYAAESGVNDAAQIISTALASSTPPTGSELDRTSCSAAGYDSMYLPLNTTNSLSSTSNVAYTCILVNGEPGEIQTAVDTVSKIIPINTTSNIGSIKLSWSTQGTSTTPTSSCPTTAKLPKASTYTNCGIGVLRVDLLPVDSAAFAGATPSTLAKETLTFFAVPTPQGNGGTVSTVNYAGPTSSTSNTNNIIPAKCVNTAPDCTVTIAIPAAYQTHEAYEMRVSSEYEGSNLSLSAASPSNTNLPISGAQVLIDATGRAQNVVRRIQVYVPIGMQSNQLSDYAIQSTDSICKRFIVMQGSNPSNGYYASDATGAGVNANNATLDPLCQ